MRIGVFTSWLEGGGAERQAALWARLCARRGHDVTVMTLHRSDSDFEVTGARLVHIPKRNAADLPRIAYQLRRAARDLDVIVAFEPYPALCCAVAGLRIPWMIVTGKLPSRWGDASRIPAWMLRAAFERAAIATAPSDGMIDSHRDLGIRRDGRWRMIPNIVDERAFASRSTAREGVLFVGRLVALKNPLLAVESARAADTPLTLLGAGELESEIEREIGAHPGGPPARIRRYDPEPWSLYAGHRVLIVTSEYESFGNVLVESLAAGTPVVSVDCDFGPREILGGARYSRLVSSWSVDALSDALGSVLRRPYSDPEAAECVAIARRYSEANVEPLILETVESLADAPSPGETDVLSSR